MATPEQLRAVVDRLPRCRLDADGPHVLVTAGDGTEHAISWPWRERVHPKRTKVPRPEVAVVRVAGLDDKQALLDAHPDVLFTEPHYDGYAAVLVRLPEVAPELLAELLDESRQVVLERASRRRRR